ncbi:hypothetical protein K7432_017441 [Basidiobolus ranarum]|uniref:Uncharacterized protein n=1 Tax=Basidiobolus ranarum TaxID=34480 RepID=A0ABR2VKD2_9FUNG
MKVAVATPSTMVKLGPCGLAQRLELQPPLAARLMRDSERRELEKIDVFSPKPYIRQSLKTTSTTPIRSRNNATRTTMSIAPTSPFVKCLLSNTPAKLLSKSSHQSADLSFNHPPKIKRLSMQGELDRERKKGTLQNDQILPAVDPMTLSEKVKRPLPVELDSSPISSTHDLNTNIPSDCKPTQLGGLQDLLSSSPVRDADEDPFMTSSKRRKLSDQ